MSVVFFDTSVLLYTVKQSGDPRTAIARDLLSTGGAISVQCLNEFVNVARRKLSMRWEAVLAARDELMTLCDPIIPLDVELHRVGVAIAKSYQLSTYDGFIVAAALSIGCGTLYSEDMRHGLVIDGVLTIENPFAQAAR